MGWGLEVLLSLTGSPGGRTGLGACAEKRGLTVSERKVRQNAGNAACCMADFLGWEIDLGPAALRRHSRAWRWLSECKGKC